MKQSFHHLDKGKRNLPLSANHKKIEFGFSFAAADGESGNVAEDNGDLPLTLQKPGHVYNPNIEQGYFLSEEENEITRAMHISDKRNIGMSYRNDDSYLSNP